MTRNIALCGRGPSGEEPRSGSSPDARARIVGVDMEGFPMVSAGTAADRDHLRDLDAHVVDRVGRVLRTELAARQEELRTVAPETALLVDGVQGYLEGGKLLRPRFCFWGGVAALGRHPEDEETEALARYGAAIELVQAAALMHDDVIDHSPTRRGRPAMHVAAAERHRREALSGDPEDFGVAVAIVLGDLALSWSEQLASGIDGESLDTSRARGEFDRLRTEVMSGQYLDILHQAGGFTSTADAERAALEVIHWKTVPYTVLRPVRIGAALLGAGPGALEALSRWSIEIGTAFQLRDDLLSVVGDTDQTGKPIGGDIEEGKRTVLLARTLAGADRAQRELLERTVGRTDAPASDVAAVHELMLRTGAVASVSEEVQERAARAAQILDRAEGLGEEGRAGLAALAAQATEVASLPS